MEGGSGIVPSVGAMANTAVAVASGCGPAAGGSGCGPAAGGSGRDAAAGGSGRGPAAGGSGRGPAAGGSGRGAAAGGGGCGPAVDGNGCGPGCPFGADVDGATGCKAVTTGARVERRRAALEMEVGPRLDELGIDAQHVAVRHSRYGVAAVIVDRGLAVGAIVGDVVGPDDVLVGAVIGGVGDRGVVRVHLRIGHGNVVDEGVIVPSRIRDLASPRTGVRGVLIIVVGGVVRDGDVVAIVDLDSLAAVPVDQVALHQGWVGVVRVPAGLRALEVVDDDSVAVAVRAGLGDVVVAGVVGDDGSVARGGGVAGDVLVLPDRDA